MAIIRDSLHSHVLNRISDDHNSCTSKPFFFSFFPTGERMMGPWERGKKTSEIGARPSVTRERERKLNGIGMTAQTKQSIFEGGEIIMGHTKGAHQAQNEVTTAWGRAGKQRGAKRARFRIRAKKGNPRWEFALRPRRRLCLSVCLPPSSETLFLIA